MFFERSTTKAAGQWHLHIQATSVTAVWMWSEFHQKCVFC